MTISTDLRPRPGAVLPWAAVDLDFLCDGDRHRGCGADCSRSYWIVVRVEEPGEVERD